ncbi:NYN domain-containing protein [Brevibacterium sp. 91QC2O2]|uniref:NYN domain-containing protein n=1 Tax=Brevibacterium sp. 91QC2O2 TaxID=2968458 RepID=UPI00211B7CDE|nr:NYN domain-containing protein [Brevibacterium sp. 91QC2O2]MCQ9368646.1 NYN domain-containing protein [Brevibacterium sp. 91QC2O2]
MKTRFTDSIHRGGLHAADLPSRRLVLVDIENVVGGGVCMPHEVQRAQTAVVTAVGLRPGDQVILACGRFGADVVGFEWEGARRLLFREGPDGADLELLEVLGNEHVEERYSEVVLVSGDGIFAEIVARLGQFGVDVTVASLPDSCSKRLKLAAARMVDIHFDLSGLTEAA